jgi:hypothetical protein
MEGKTKPNAPAFGINRRALLYAAALLPAPALLRIASALAQNADSQLASWNEGAAKQAIIDFVRVTTDQASPKFVPPEPPLSRPPCVKDDNHRTSASNKNANNSLPSDLF